MSSIKGLAAALAVSAGLMTVTSAQAATVLATITHNYGNDAGYYMPGGNDKLHSKFVKVGDYKSQRFNDSFSFAGLSYSTIDSLVLTLTYNSAGPTGCGPKNCNRSEDWQVQVQGANAAASDDDFYGSLVDSASPLSFTLTAATDTGSITAWAHSIATEALSFWFNEATSGRDNFRLSSASLQVIGTPAIVPVPAAGLLLLGALGGLGLMRRRKTT